ncbi:peptide-methionine (S)-S-oxide reductase MsrA [Brachybacterium endophyticum]|uniref:Peptide methionine sulfoxide reductase MsrA n=1 Tax=Brachybacterium endophyticum TaxID=2182385 RepID=A0A2U2RP91_9MICO|nr:peptide-methionine (S)-S-oxide reductase MsrA [Brachybacterium endophyticum]PWH07679.1 peptide-methionine (S)-S-oxide reductase MsrA [Brachybacterium endophyticum]
MWQIMDMLNAHKKDMVAPEDALPGREDYPYPLERRHAVLGTDMLGPWPEGSEELILAGGCFWGIERIAWQIPGVHTTSAGYAGGYTPHPTYEEVFSAKTGHTEAVRVIYAGADQDERDTVLRRLLEEFWQQHDPTTAMRQGNDVGTEYRSAVYWTSAHQGEIVRDSAVRYQEALDASGRGQITTELSPLAEAGDGQYYTAEPEHQQYLAKNPYGYCNHGFNGVACSL